MTTVNVTAVLRKGKNHIDLNGPDYTLGPDFLPPGERQLFNVASGSSANKNGGGEIVGSTRKDRPWKFNVRVLGLSGAHVENNVRRLLDFISAWDEPGEPLFFEYKGNTLTAPCWGQFGAALRYEVVHGEASAIGNYYQVGNTRDRSFEIAVSLLVKPFALGARQRLATASGGVIEDVLGEVDGMSRGLIIPPAATNKMTNPVFGHATWNNGWTAGPKIIAAANTDAEYIYPGASASAKVTSIDTANNLFLQSINAGNTNKHTLTAWIIKPDRSAVTIADIVLLYDVAVAPTFYHEGNGVYRARATMDGINAAKYTGVVVTQGVTLYLLGMQFEETAYGTPLVWGDLLGCAWTGTAHASTSTRAAARVGITATSALDVGGGTVCLVVRMNEANTWAANMQLWTNAATSFNVAFTAADDKILFGDATNTATSAAQTWAAGDVLTLHFTWTVGALKVYRAGVEIATAAAYTPPTLAAALYVCSNSTPTAHVPGTVLGFTTFSKAMTATEVAAHYAAVAAVVASGSRVDYIPWLWTKDGDDITDNADDGTYQNWGIVSGVPGNAEADTYYKGIMAGAAAGDSLYLSRFDMSYSQFIKPTFLTSPSAAAVITVDTNSTPIAYVTFDMAKYRIMAGKSFFWIMRGNEDGANTIQLRTSIDPGSLPYYTSEFEPSIWRTTGTTDYSIDSAPSLHIVDDLDMYEVFGISRTVTARLSAKRTTGTADFNFGSAQLFPAPVLVMRDPTASPSFDGFLLHELDGRGLFYSAAFSFRYNVLGNIVNMKPNCYNALISLIGAEGVLSGPGQSISWTIYIDPRWGLI